MAAELTTRTMRQKARTVITTDGEVDDQDSFIRALLYANDMDIAGIVLTSSVFHYAGDEARGIVPYRWTGSTWPLEFIDAYAQVYPNLAQHDPAYPTPDYLRSVYKVGNVSYKGEMSQVTEGSRFLEQLFLDDDPRTLYVQTWGGTNTTARALKSIEERYAGTPEWGAVQAKVYGKLVLYIILDQDESYANYIAPHWPNLQVLVDASSFWHFAYLWKQHPAPLIKSLGAAWHRQNVLGDHGPLMARYALMGDGKTMPGELDDEQRGWDAYLAANPGYQRYDFISEGDSPSFFYLLQPGLRALEDPTFGGWGGRFGADHKNTVGDYDPYTGRYEASYTLMRWVDDIQADFAARVDWCTAERFQDANHAPSVQVLEGIDVTAAPGQRVTLTARGDDPDGDALSYRWWHYFEADTYANGHDPVQLHDDVHAATGFLIDRSADAPAGKQDALVLEDANKPQVSFVVPADAQPGDTIHLIAQVQDDGAHGLKGYQRVVITAR